MTGFIIQYRSEKISVKKLLKDNTLKSTLPSKLLFISKRDPGLRNMIARNVVDPPRRTATFLERVGFYKVVDAYPVEPLVTRKERNMFSILIMVRNI